MTVVRGIPRHPVVVGDSGTAFAGSSSSASLVSQPQIIPLDVSPNQSWQATVSIDGVVTTFFVFLSYNEIAGYWVASLYDSGRNLLMDSLPLLTGLNLLSQFSYLRIGSLYILNVSGAAQDSPDNTDLGSDFKLVWSNTVLQNDLGGSVL